MMSAQLAALAERAAVGPSKQLVVVLDQAGWHTSPKLVVPDGIHLVLLPSHTPELQPTERIWPYLREEFANATPPDRAELLRRLERRCLWLSDNPSLVRSVTHFHWWPEP